MYLYRVHLVHLQTMANVRSGACDGGVLYYGDEKFHRFWCCIEYQGSTEGVC